MIKKKTISLSTRTPAPRTGAPYFTRSLSTRFSAQVSRCFPTRPSVPFSLVSRVARGMASGRAPEPRAAKPTGDLSNVPLFFLLPCVSWPERERVCTVSHKRTDGRDEKTQNPFTELDVCCSRSPFPQTHLSAHDDHVRPTLIKGIRAPLSPLLPPPPPPHPRG